MERQVYAFLASIESQPEYSASTCLAYASDLRVFLEHLQYSLQRPPELGDLTPQQIAIFLQAEARSGRRQSTLVRRRATLRTFYRYLIQIGDLPGEGYGIDDAQVGQAINSAFASPVTQCLTEDQLASVLAIIETSPRPRARRDHAILLMLLETGLSVGSLVRLDLEDIDLENGMVSIPGENGSLKRVPLGEVAPALDRYLQEGRPELNHGMDEKALFISQMNSRLSRQGLWQILRHWGQMVDPPLELSPRLVRNTAALRMVRARRPIGEIQTMLGHDNQLSTQALLRRLDAACQAEPADNIGSSEKTLPNG